MDNRRRLVVAGAVIALALLTSVSAGAQPLNFRAHLSGGEEVPPVDTNARGQATFKLTGAGDVLSYKLIVSNIEGVFAAHIHCAPAGLNGPVGVTLFSGGPGDVDGILSQGTITSPNSGNACGWATLADVVAAIESDGAYVNVHTLDNPPGEIRGQIR